MDPPCCAGGQVAAVHTLPMTTHVHEWDRVVWVVSTSPLEALSVAMASVVTALLKLGQDSHSELTSRHAQRHDNCENRCS
jgi:hypothetical protein